MRTSRLMLLALAGAAMLFPHSAGASVDYVVVNKVAPDGLDTYGRDVATSPAFVAVGATRRGGSEVVLIYPRLPDGTLGTPTEIAAPDGVVGDAFGAAIALDKRSNALIVGAPKADLPGMPDAGAAYVFSRRNDDWLLRAKLTAPVAAEGDQFGAAVATTGGYFAVGAPESDRSAAIYRAGAVAVFAESEQGLVADEWITPSVRGAVFGSAIALSDYQELFVGAPGWSAAEGQQSQGAVYFYQRLGFGYGWPLHRIIDSPLYDADARFGIALAYEREMLAIGAPKDGSGIGAIGAVHIYEQNEGIWVRNTTVKIPQAGQADAFGADVAIDGTARRIIASAPGYGGIPGVRPASGAVTIIERQPDLSWVRSPVVNPPAGARMLGTVTIDGEMIAVTDPGDRMHTGSPGTGAMYLLGTDIAPPDTLITEAPPSPTRQDYGLMRFTGSDDRSAPEALTFQCRLDRAPFSPCSSPHLLSSLAEGANTFEVRAVDLAGKMDPTPARTTIHVDTTAPTITGSRWPQANANGWVNTPVSVAFTCNDGSLGSGIHACGPNTTLTGNRIGASVTGTAEDRVGLSATTTVSGINIDVTAPELTTVRGVPAPAVRGWHNSPFTVEWFCTDALSGVANTERTATATEGAAHRLTGQCIDGADNSTTRIYGPYNLDKTPPTVTVDEPWAWPASRGLIVSGRAADGLSGVYRITVVLRNALFGQEYEVDTTCAGGCQRPSVRWETEQIRVSPGFYFIAAVVEDTAGLLNRVTTTWATASLGR